MDKTKIAVDTYNKIAKIYKDKYFEDLSDIPYINKFLSFLPKKAKILDIGCGPGNFTKYIKDRGFNVVGIDLSKEMLKIARLNVPNIKFKYMDMRKMSFKTNSFDGILVAYSLIHISRKEIINTLKGFFKVIKPGGFILICVQKGKPDQIVKEPLMKTEKMFINFFSKKTLSTYLLRSGFQIILIKVVYIEDSNSLSNKVIYTVAQKVNR